MKPAPSRAPGGLSQTKRRRQAILDHARALVQRDGCTRPALAGGAEGDECGLIVPHAGDVLHDALAVRRPAVDAEGEMIRRSS